MTSIPSPASPLPRLSFRLARPPASLTLAGSNRAETTGLIVTNRLREAATKLATRLTTKFQRNSASRVTANMCLAANSVVLVRLFGIALLRRELCPAESRSRYLPDPTGVKLRRRLRPCFECGDWPTGRPPLSTSLLPSLLRRSITPSGYHMIRVLFPRIATMPQSWAEVRNAVGVCLNHFILDNSSIIISTRASPFCLWTAAFASYSVLCYLNHVRDTWSGTPSNPRAKDCTAPNSQEAGVVSSLHLPAWSYRLENVRFRAGG